MKLIDYNQIEENIRIIKKTNDIVLVVKNDAYGFGIDKVVEIALANGIDSFAVNTIDEAIYLRGITNSKILLFGYSIKYIDDLIKYNIIPTASSDEEIIMFNKFKIKYALEIDSGMNRFGIKEYNEEYFKDQYLSDAYVHFYSDRGDNALLINKIKQLCNKYNKTSHFGGSILYTKTNEKLRIGKMVYNDALGFYANVTMIKRIKKGETVGYDALYTANTDETIAILDVGYYNGIRVGFDGYVFFKEKRYKVIGKICMNHTFILADDSLNIGDQVEFFGKNISILDFIKWNNMTEYECFLSIR